MSNDTFVISDDVFAILKTNPGRMEAFAGAFEVEVDSFKAGFESRLEDEKAAEAAKAAEERIAAKAVKWADYVSSLNDYEADETLVRLVDSGMALATNLSDEDSKVEVSFSINIGEDGSVSVVASASGISSSKKTGGKGGPRKSYDYFCDGELIEGRLKPFILKSFTDSDAAGLIREHDPKTGTKKGAMSAFDACEKDELLKERITRTEKEKDNG
jgi:hypothetical protein